MIRCTATASILALASGLALSQGLTASPAEAQSLHNARPTQCRDAAGTRVVSVNTTRLRNVGMAGRIRGRPVMLFNPVIMRRFRPATRTFWFYHECAHHALGHSLGHRPMSRERDADCWAIRQMKRRGLLTAARLRTIQQDLYPLNGDGVLYLPGPQRAAHVGYCATGRRTLPQMVRRAPGRRLDRRADRRRVAGAGFRPRYRARYNLTYRRPYRSPEQAHRPAYRGRYGERTPGAGTLR